MQQERSEQVHVDGLIYSERFGVKSFNIGEVVRELDGGGEVNRVDRMRAVAAGPRAMLVA